MADDNVIGIIGGMGPHAGLDLAQKIMDQTPDVQTDQDHLSVALLNYPARIPDRSTWLADRSKPSPIGPLVRITEQLQAAGATVAGMPCNTAHIPVLFERITERLRERGATIRILHMIRETAHHLQGRLPAGRRVGVLSTVALYRAGLYRQELEAAGFKAVTPDQEVAENVVNPVIFDGDFGIKAKSHPVTDKARRYLFDAIDHLREKGAEAVVLGCTELPLAVPEKEHNGLPLVDPAVILARALIRETHPERLRETASTEG